MHGFPRFQGDPFKIHANWHVKPTRQELNEIAELIRQTSELSGNRNWIKKASSKGCALRYKQL
jgi:hypothetical protein